MAQFLKVALLALVALTAQAAEVFNDPTRPAQEYLPTVLRASAVSESALLLQSILLSPQRKVAIINGRAVMVGDRIQGYQLQSLDNRSATLKNTHGVITLQLLPVIRSERAPAGLKKSQGVQQ